MVDVRGAAARVRRIWDFMRLLSLFPLFILLQFSLCGQKDPVLTERDAPGQLTVLAQEADGGAIDGVAISIGGLLQAQTAPATFELPAEAPLTVGVAKEGWTFTPGELTVTLASDEERTVTFVGEAAATRLVLLEDFSNTGCVPCPAADEAMWTAVGAASGTAMPIAWHPNFPAPSDPFFLYNILLGHYANDGSRNSFYGISQLPHIRVDGEAVGVPSDAVEIGQLIEARLALEPTLEMTVAHSVAGAEVTVSAEGTVLRAPPAGNWRLYLVLIENYVEFDAPNGQTDYRNTVRHVNGEDAGFNHPLGEPVTLSTGGTFSGSVTFTPDFDVVDVDDLRAVVFVQDSDSKLILDAAVEATGGP